MRYAEKMLLYGWNGAYMCVGVRSYLRQGFGLSAGSGGQSYGIYILWAY